MPYQWVSDQIRQIALTNSTVCWYRHEDLSNEIPPLHPTALHTRKDWLNLERIILDVLTYIQEYIIWHNVIYIRNYMTAIVFIVHTFIIECVCYLWQSHLCDPLAHLNTARNSLIMNGRLRKLMLAFKQMYWCHCFF